MIDFNTRKRALKKISDFAEKHVVLLLPCLLAALFVKVFYAVVCNIDIALSDKDGNFLGFNRGKRKKKSTRKIRRQDDIVYVKKPLLGRLLSAVLAFSFVLAFMPEFENLGFTVSAAEITKTVGTTEYVLITGNYYVVKSEYDNAIAAVPLEETTKEAIIPGNNVVRLNWRAPSNAAARTAMTGYKIKGLAKDEVAAKTATTATITNAGTGTYGLSICTYTSLKLYEYIPENPLADPPVLEAMTTTSLKQEVESTALEFQTVTLNKTMKDPGIVKAEKNATNTGITVTWKHVTDYELNEAHGYFIFRAVKDGTTGQITKEGFVNVGTVYAGEGKVNAAGEISATDTVSPGQVYIYYIQAWRNVFGEDTTKYNAKNSGYIFSSDYIGGADTIDEATVPNPVSITGKVGTNTSNQLVVNWSLNGYATGYYIFRSETDYATTPSFAKLKEDCGEPAIQSLSAKSYVDEATTVNGKVYYYYIISYLVQGGGKAELMADAVKAQGTLGVAVGTPTSFGAVTGDGKVTLSWKAVTGAAGYRLYIEKKGNADGTDLGVGTSYYVDTTNLTYTHDDGDPWAPYNGDTYSYWLYAYKMIPTATEDRTFSAQPSDVRTVIVGAEFKKPSDITAIPSDGTITLSWTAVTGATSYIVYAQKANGTVEPHEVTSNKFVHSGLVNSDVWSYYVQGYKKVKGKDILTPKSVTVSATVGIPLLTPTDIAVTSADGKAVLTWTAVKNAEGYIVYATCNNQTTQFDVTKNTFTHTNLSNKETWSYYVVAYKTVSSTNTYPYPRYYSNPSLTVSITIGATLAVPKDFTVTTTDGTATATWTAVTGAEGYVLYASSGSNKLSYDVSKLTYVHSGLKNGDSWTYYLVAYKTVSGSRTYSDPTESRTIQVGVSMSSPKDLVATAGNKQIDLSWTAVTGAEGYVVYLYSTNTFSFEPVTILSGVKYSHTGLKNGTQYTYMVAAYKTINGVKYYGDYSMAVSAIPTTGSATDIDRALDVKGTAPYGISHSELISAAANHDAFDQSVDIYFSSNDESAQVVKDVLSQYAKGLDSFIIIPFDIACYLSNSWVSVTPNSGYTVNITVPVPEEYVEYRDYISVVHIDQSVKLLGSYGKLEVLPSALLQERNVWCIQFACTSFSPYAFVIYKDQISDISSGMSSSLAGGFAGTFDSGLLLFTALPDILPNNKKLKLSSVGKKYYRIKKTTIK